MRLLGRGLSLALEQVTVEEDDQYRIAGVRGFGNGVFFREVIRGNETSYKTLNRLRAGNLVMSRLKAFEGAIGFVPENLDGHYASAEFPTFEVRAGEADARYIKHLCSWPDFWQKLQGQSKGIGARRERVSAQRLLAIEVPLPSLEEQRRVADKLDALMSKFGTTTAVSPSAEDARQLAVSGLDKVLARWATGTVRVDQTCALVSDVVHPGDDPSPAKEFVGLEHIAPHFGTRIGSVPLGDEKGRKFRFAPGDVLYGYLRPYLNKVWLADRAGLCSVEQYVLRPNDVMPGELIAAGLRSKTTLDKVLDATHNLQLPRLRSGLLMAMEIPSIPPEHHKEAVADVNVFMQRVRALDDRQRHRDELLTALRPALLNAAFSGQL
jgi:type I restriction enzyme S subunit